ncbi:unnamed protein product [Paramecium pentaurelia]|uniref:MORN repeat protein n=1 Tax=Paramecium pentaurelia TaxID=43138 RepID=A0A8S1XH44_9CILI|nr:unnamed protein product [Paramecium pentaurelia]
MGNQIEIGLINRVDNRSGVKTGIWEIYWIYVEKNNKIAGGEYDKQGNKIGKWIEQSDRFRYGNQSTSEGKYNKQGVRVGMWDIYLKNDGKNNKIGGGEYDEQGRKIGKWIEQSNEFQSVNQTTWIGEYNNKGVKTGIWDIYQNNKGNNNKIGGGRYDEHGNKIGLWIEQNDGFWTDNQSTYTGEYNVWGSQRWKMGNILEI